MSAPIFSQENDYVIARPSVIETLQFDGTCELQDGKRFSWVMTKVILISTNLLRSVYLKH